MFYFYLSNFNLKKRSWGNRDICTVGILGVCRFMKDLHTYWHSKNLWTDRFFLFF